MRRAPSLIFGTRERCGTGTEQGSQSGGGGLPQAPPAPVLSSTNTLTSQSQVPSCFSGISVTDISHTRFEWSDLAEMSSDLQTKRCCLLVKGTATASLGHMVGVTVPQGCTGPADVESPPSVWQHLLAVELFNVLMSPFFTSSPGSSGTCWASRWAVGEVMNINEEAFCLGVCLVFLPTRVGLVAMWPSQLGATWAMVTIFQSGKSLGGHGEGSLPLSKAGATTVWNVLSDMISSPPTFTFLVPVSLRSGIVNAESPMKRRLSTGPLSPQTGRGPALPAGS